MKRDSAATLMGFAVAVALTACSDSAEPIPDGRISVVQLAVDNLTLSLGDSTRLTLLPVLPPGIIPDNVRWSSSAPAVAAVRRLDSSSGMAIAMTPGHAVIYAGADDARDSVLVTVR